MKQNDQYGKYNQIKLFLRLLKYIAVFWDKYILVIVLLIIQGTIHTLPVLLLSKLPVFIGQGQVNDYLIFCFAFLLPTFLFRWVIFDSLLYTLLWYIGLKCSLKFRLDLYRHMQGSSLRFFQSRPVGEHMYRANADIDALIPLLNSFLNGLPALISYTYQTLLMAYLVSMAGSEILFYLTIVLIPIFALVHYIYSFIKRLDYRKRVRAQELTAVLRESIAGIRVIKAFDRIRFTIRRYYSAMVKYLKSTQSAYLLQILVADQIRVSPIHVLWPLSLPFFAYLGLKGKIPIITWGSIVYFSRAMLYNLNGVFFFFEKIRLYLIPAQRLFETLDMEPDIVEPAGAKKIEKLEGRLEFDSVHFSYREGFPILQDISFSLEPGQKTALIGPSGAGKSTIAMLALRMYDADSGNIRIDGADIRQIHMRSVMDQTGVILQETFLFNGNIRDNIRYANPKASDEEVVRAARAAGIHDDILAMPRGYDTDEAEGSSLSGGQKQRIAIARALIKQPKLLLLDEATSSLDIATEDAIIETLRKEFYSVSTLIISHRISLIADADEIVVIDKGKVVESGKHDDLLNNKSLYFNLYQQQIKQV